MGTLGFAPVTITGVKSYRCRVPHVLRYCGTLKAGAARIKPEHDPAFGLGAEGGRAVPGRLYSKRPDVTIGAVNQLSSRLPRKRSGTTRTHHASYTFRGSHWGRRKLKRDE
jgi:hypothetical protein